MQILKGSSCRSQGDLSSIWGEQSRALPGLRLYFGCRRIALLLFFFFNLFCFKSKVEILLNFVAANTGVTEHLQTSLLPAFTCD